MQGKTELQKRAERYVQDKYPLYILTDILTSFYEDATNNENKILKQQLLSSQTDNERLRKVLGFIIEYTFAFESDYEKCLEHIRKLSQTTLENK